MKKLIIKVFKWFWNYKPLPLILFWVIISCGVGYLFYIIFEPNILPFLLSPIISLIVYILILFKLKIKDKKIIRYFLEDYTKILGK